MEALETRATVIALVVGVVVGLGLAWASIPGPSGTNCNSGSSGGTPLGAGYGFGDVVSTTLGMEHWYNTSEASAPGVLRLDNFELEVVDRNGSVSTPGQAWNTTVLDASGAWIASYSVAGGHGESLTTQSTSLVRAGQEFSLYTSPENVSGNAWALIETGTYDGCPISGGTNLQLP